MQVVCKCEQVEMKRDMDLIRSLLIQMDEEPRLDGTQWLEINHHDFPGHSLQEVAYHVGLLVEVGYVRGSIGGGMPMISKLTWEGHEFVDDIKDSGIWANTKARVEGLSGVALSVVAEIAKAEIKKRLGLL
jgi:hypothetical protein